MTKFQRRISEIWPHLDESAPICSSPIALTLPTTTMLQLWPVSGTHYLNPSKANSNTHPHLHCTPHCCVQCPPSPHLPSLVPPLALTLHRHLLCPTIFIPPPSASSDAHHLLVPHTTTATTTLALPSPFLIPPPPSHQWTSLSLDADANHYAHLLLHHLPHTAISIV